MTVEYVILSGARSAKSKNLKEKARFLGCARNDKKGVRNDGKAGFLDYARNDRRVRSK